MPTHFSTRRPRRLPVRAAAAAAVLALLGACNDGNDEPQVAIGGLVVDGALQGATVCYDLNDNAACDSDEPSATTDAAGRYQFDVAEARAGQHAVIVQVPATAIDADTGAAVGAAFTLKAPASGSGGAQRVFVSPLSTAVAHIAQDSDKTVAEAAAQVQASLNLAISPLADFTASSVAADAAAAASLAARALGQVTIQTTKLATAANVPAASVAALVRQATTTQLDTLAATLADNPDSPVVARIAQAATAVQEELNLTPATVQAVAQQAVQPSVAADAPGLFVSLRRFAYTDANNYSYTLFTGDSSVRDAQGAFVANEVRKTQSAGADLPFIRNQVYWTGSAWVGCETQWQVSTNIKAATAVSPQTGLYCGASRSETRIVWQDIAGRTLREVIAQIRAYPLGDTPAAHTDPVSGRPVNWGPEPALLPAASTFPAGAKLQVRTQLADLGGVDRIETTTKSSVRWPDGVFRQATSLEQYGGMPGNLVDASVVPANANTVFVFDLPLATQPDTTLEAFKRWRAGFDIANLRVRFYQCDVRKSDQAALNCVSGGDGRLAISTQGGVRLMRVASGWPAVLTARLNQQRFWAEYAGTVMRGVRDLQRTRYEQRLNAPAWEALRTALNIPAHTAATAPAGPGPGAQLRNFSYTDANNYSYRRFDGDDSAVDAAGYYGITDTRKTVSGGVVQPFVRNRSYWTGTAWYDCPDSGPEVLVARAAAPFDSVYCKTYIDQRTQRLAVSIGGRFMADVVNDIRSYASTDYGDPYNDWGPVASAHPQLASTRFPAGATMDYRAFVRTATPWAIAVTPATDQVRLAPSPTSTAAFATWPFATTLEDVVAKYPGSLVGTTLNGNTALQVHSYTATPPSTLYTNRVEIRVAFDASGSKARFTQNNRLASNGNTANHVTLLDTTYTVETLGSVRLLKFAAMPAGFEGSYYFQRAFAERNGAVWYAFKDSIPTTPTWSIRLNKPAMDALFQTLGIQ